MDSHWPHSDLHSTTQLLWLSENDVEGTEWTSCPELGDEAKSGGENKWLFDTNPVLVLEQFSCTGKSQHWRSSVAIWKLSLYYCCLRKFPCSGRPYTGHAYIDIFPFSVYVWIWELFWQKNASQASYFDFWHKQSELAILEVNNYGIKLKRVWGACCSFEL